MWPSKGQRSRSRIRVPDTTSISMGMQVREQRLDHQHRAISKEEISVRNMCSKTGGHIRLAWASIALSRGRIHHHHQTKFHRYQGLPMCSRIRQQGRASSIRKMAKGPTTDMSMRMMVIRQGPMLVTRLLSRISTSQCTLGWEAKPYNRETSAMLWKINIKRGCRRRLYLLDRSVSPAES